MAQLAVPRRQNVLLWAIALLGVALLTLGSFTVLGPTPWSSSQLSGVSKTAPPRVAYFEFGFNADTLWSQNPNDSASRQAWFTARHAPGFGLVPSLSPDGTSTVYTVLPSNTLAPSPDAPAQLWLVRLQDGVRPRLIAGNFDLLVAAIWAHDGESVVLRRSGSKSASGGFELVSISLGDSAEEAILTSRNAVFPVAFAPDGNHFYYVTLQPAGSFLFAADLVSGNQSLLSQLSGGLTRDWTLSPTGGQLAFLELSGNGQEVSSRAYIFDLTTGARSLAGPPDTDAFNPTWDSSGNLLLGQLVSSQSASGMISLLVDGSRTGSVTLAPPDAGFDVPLAHSQESGWIAIRSFEGRTAANPGRSVLAVLDPSGERQQIAAGEVTFLGWITP